MKPASSGLLLFMLALLAPPQGLAQALPGLCADPTQSLLWEVEHADMDARGVEIHLYGSIHVGKPDFYPLHPTVENLFRSADKLVFEVDPQSAADPQVAIAMQLRGLLPEGQTLEDVLEPETLRNLEEVLRGMGIPLANFMSFKPWMVALLLTNLQAGALGYDPQFGLESYFMREKTAASEVLELESLQQQLDMLESLDPEVFLGYSLEEFDSGAETMENMVSAWRCGDKDELTESVFAVEELLEGAGEDERQALGEVFDKLFTERNRTMAEGIRTFAREGSGSYFVVVGSGHLLGEGSVLELLRESGYGVTPVGLEP